jgi:peptidoglycan/LPS O-acetylase OafA/YrhL
MAGKLKHWRTGAFSYARDEALPVIHRPTVSPQRELTYTASSWAVLGATRFVLALIVFLSHLRWFVPPSAVLEHIGMLGDKAAVLGFFLISGASIAHSHRDRPEGFYRRRFLRIYPLYFVAIIVTEILTLLYPHGIVCPDGRPLLATGYLTAIANLFLLQDFIAIPMTYNLPLWTLSIEVFYYLLAPRFARWSESLIVGLIVLSLLTFHFQYLVGERLFGFAALVFAWPWLIGFLLVRTTRRSLPLALGVLGAIPVFLSRELTQPPLSVVTYLTVLVLIVAVPYASLPDLARRLTNWLGDISYPLYLFHLPLGLLAFMCMGLHQSFVLIGFILLMIVALYYLVDVYWKKVFWKPLVGYVVGRLASK